jgi:hypothetical protein
MGSLQVSTIMKLRYIAWDVGIESRHLVGVCGAETRWRRTATGDRSLRRIAHGICQIQTRTAREMGYRPKVRGRVTELYQIESARYSALYLKSNFKKLEKTFEHYEFSDEQLWDLTYASYNRGVDGVKKNIEGAIKAQYVKWVRSCYKRETCRREI